MGTLNSKTCVTDDATFNAGRASSSAQTSHRTYGNRAALAKAVFRSRDTRAVGLHASLEALALMNRLRFIRTLDLAFHLYSDRTFTAALAAANNLMKRLVRNRLVTAHTTRVGGMRIYGIAQRGVNLLGDYTNVEAKAHRSLRDVRYPEHRLWANLIVITAQVRGLTAMTESEVLQYERSLGELVRDESGVERVVPRKLLTIRNCRRHGERKGLTPDALLQHGNERVWIELDTSKRSRERVNDLLELVASVGTKLSDDTRLARVIVFTKERRSWTHICGVLQRSAEKIGDRAPSYLRQTFLEGMFDVWLPPTDTQEEASRHVQDRRLGEVQVLMLPDPRSKAEGWYDEDWLPFAQGAERLWSLNAGGRQVTSS